ncbi:hypothetical protein [Jatrophihabitans lederbergiae]|uniref:ESX-1 secretion-associated protein n=1 Tax=Jatrophihabitans lederbergiae TaxID=3075547 RepID=A0ABU2JHI1_9ACTN|nr:hypothetical protein [Jatrophihabitans sp. DSM 44399]MDT0264231.1 hypothetical protein [Jatrophihabitans sp. DSM 44399]
MTEPFDEKRPAISDWMHAHDRIIDDLSSANDTLTTASGTYARTLDGTIRGNAAAVGITVEAAASRLLRLVDKAQALPPIPDKDTNRFFRNATSR